MNFCKKVSYESEVHYTRLNYIKKLWVSNLVSIRMSILQFHPITLLRKDPGRIETYSKSPHIRTYFFETGAKIGSYFKGTNTNFKI